MPGPWRGGSVGLGGFGRCLLHHQLPCYLGPGSLGPAREDQALGFSNGAALLSLRSQASLPLHDAFIFSSGLHCLTSDDSLRLSDPPEWNAGTATKGPGGAGAHHPPNNSPRAGHSQPDCAVTPYRLPTIKVLLPTTPAPHGTHIMVLGGFKFQNQNRVKSKL